ncbi:MAG: hypothetical protein IPK32_19440 [Verrucomicrobiaceae bacterium]|nr:hypothetical protein [Verrucomicrobiaceae bacterium]
MTTTYTLDLETSTVISRLAQLWNAPEAEVIKRAVKAAAPASNSDIAIRLEAAEKLQKSLAARGVDFDEWQRVVHESRR